MDAPFYIACYVSSSCYMISGKGIYMYVVVVHSNWQTRHVYTD